MAVQCFKRQTLESHSETGHPWSYSVFSAVSGATHFNQLRSLCFSIRATVLIQVWTSPRRLLCNIRQGRWGRWVLHLHQTLSRQEGRLNLSRTLATVYFHLSEPRGGEKMSPAGSEADEANKQQGSSKRIWMKENNEKSRAGETHFILVPLV